jgi:hypothetical protein
VGRDVIACAPQTARDPSTSVGMTKRPWVLGCSHIGSVIHFVEQFLGLFQIGGIEATLAERGLPRAASKRVCVLRQDS